MNHQDNEIISAIDGLKSVLHRTESALPLRNEAASQFTRMLCIANYCLDPVTEDAIERASEVWRDIDAIRQVPHVLFDHHAIGPLLKDIRLRKKRDEKLAEERLRLLGVKIVDGSEFAVLNFDLFRVDSVQPTSVPKFHHTACRILTPAFTWTDQYGEPQVRHGSAVAYVFQQDNVSRNIEEVARG